MFIYLSMGTAGVFSSDPKEGNARFTFTLEILTSTIISEASHLEASLILIDSTIIFPAV